MNIEDKINALGEAHRDLSKEIISSICGTLKKPSVWIREQVGDMDDDDALIAEKLKELHGEALKD